MFLAAMGTVVLVGVAAVQAPSAADYHRVAARFFNQARSIDNPASSARRDAIAKGIAAEDRALAIDPEFLDALLYKYLLLRLHAGDRTGTEQQKALLEQAAAVEAKARAIRTAHRERIVSHIDPVDISVRVPAGFKAVVDQLHPSRVGGSIPTPKLLRNVRPVYPPSAQAFGLEGVVIVEAVIGPEGDVRAARVVRSIPLLDEGAVEGIRQWRFEPMKVNGAPRALILKLDQQYLAR